MDHVDSGEMTEKLRAEMKRRGADAFLVPARDAFGSEYPPPSSARLARVSGFTGSAGCALITGDSAVLFVDGRYVLQARRQVSADNWEVVRSSGRIRLSAMIAARLGPGEKLGVDPWLHTALFCRRLEKDVGQRGAELLPFSDNPVDVLWPDRPLPPATPLFSHSVHHAGRSAGEKRRDVGERLAEAGADVFVLCDPHSVAWLFNIRAADIPYTPVPLIFGLCHRSGDGVLFVQESRIPADLAGQEGAEVTFADPAAFSRFLSRLAREGKKVGITPDATPWAVVAELESKGAELVAMDDPCARPRACKTRTEQNGARQAHLRDGLALVKFLHWLDETVPSGTLTERAAAEKLEKFRAEAPEFRMPSFPTISAAGANGAVVHYLPTESTDTRLSPDMLYLVDSGGQYPDGTTDVTRTVPVGTPTEEQKRRFTLVLAGHIDLAATVFPEGTRGEQLDALARRPLWGEGLDYDHGTGHGVGSFLSVHEGPQSISASSRGSEPLRPGMILSDEPGCYVAGAYGLRIENLLLVVPVEDSDGLLTFETLTLAPVDRRLIRPDLLPPGATAWLDAYHDRVNRTLASHLPAEPRNWLEKMTAPLS